MSEELQENSFPCRECGLYWSEESGASDSEDFTCENCISDLEDNANNYTNEGIINSIHHKDIEIEELWKREISQEVQNCRTSCYLDTGHIDEDFREFVINQFWYSQGLNPEDCENMSIDELREVMQN